MRLVATRGGATEGGVEILDARLPGVFAGMLEAMRARHEARKAATRAQFAGRSGLDPQTPLR